MTLCECRKADVCSCGVGTGEGTCERRGERTRSCVYTRREPPTRATANALTGHQRYSSLPNVSHPTRYPLYIAGVRLLIVTTRLACVRDACI